MRELKGLATGIGSLPHKNTDQALDLIFKYLPEIPFWPQLPRRDLREGMVAQFTQKLPIPQAPEGVFSSQEAFAHSPAENRLEEFYEKVIGNDVDYFQITRDYAAGLYAFKERLENNEALLKNIKFIKCHITGPFTFAASIKDENGAAYLHNPIFMQAFIKGLGMKALWQIKLLRKFGKPIIMFVDEPYLASFGSAYTPINREEVVSALSELTDIFKADDVLTGVHCCGNTDWSIFTDVKTIDIINFDAFNYQDKFLLYADNLKDFLRRDGVICWGIVPTDGLKAQETWQLLANKIEMGIKILGKKGLDKELLFNNLMISPACGLGSLETRDADHILKLLSDTAMCLRRK